VLAYVAERHGPEDRIRYGVQEHITVGIAKQPFDIRYLDTAHEELPFFR
jgi:hypothetical protein